MQTLGLTGEDKRSDGRLKSIFWPTVDNAWDVNYLGQQGFWICLVIAVFQLIVASLSGAPFVLVFGVIASLTFIVGGMGVRQASWPAAAMVFAIFFAGIVESLSKGRFPGILSIIAGAILLSNVRAAFLASEWKPLIEGEDKPRRFNETFGDKLADQMPAKLWPTLQIPFFVAASVLLSVVFLGMGVELIRQVGAR